MHVPERVLSPAAATAAYYSGGARTPYMTHLLSLHSFPEVLLAVSDDPALLRLDKSSLRAVSTTPLGAGDSITGISPIDSGAPTWATSMQSGTIALWDARMNEPQQRLSGPSTAPYLSIAASGPLVAAGTELQGIDAYIDIWFVPC